jgi:hypothetical protein
MSVYGNIFDNVYDNMSVISLATDPTVPDVNQIGNGTMQEYQDFTILHNLTVTHLNLSEDVEVDDDDEVMSYIEDDNSEHDSMLSMDNASVLTVMIGGPVGSAIDVVVIEHNYTVIGGIVYIHD